MPIVAGPRRTLTALAWINVVVHVAGLALAAVGMRPGTPLAPLAERLEFLARAPLGWTLGWVTWMLCAAALIAFLVAVANRVAESTPLARLGLTIAVVGAGFDLLCDSIYILAFPMIASWQPRAELLFLTVERVTGIASLVIANGCYSVAILLLSLELRDSVGRLTAIIGYAVAGFGLLLAGAGFTGVPWHAEYATGPTIGLFCVWVVLLARDLEGGRRA